MVEAPSRGESGDGRAIVSFIAPWVLWSLSLSENSHHRDRAAHGGDMAGGISRGAQWGCAGVGLGKRGPNRC